MIVVRDPGALSSRQCVDHNLHKSCAIIGKRYRPFNQSEQLFTYLIDNLRPKGELLLMFYTLTTPHGLP